MHQTTQQKKKKNDGGGCDEEKQEYISNLNFLCHVTNWCVIWCNKTLSGQSQLYVFVCASMHFYPWPALFPPIQSFLYYRENLLLSFSHHVISFQRVCVVVVCAVYMHCILLISILVSLWYCVVATSLPQQSPIQCTVYKIKKHYRPTHSANIFYYMNYIYIWH